MDKGMKGAIDIVEIHARLHRDPSTVRTEVRRRGKLQDLPRVFSQSGLPGFRCCVAKPVADVRQRCR